MAMQGVVKRLERRLGRYAIPNLTYYLVGAQGLGFVLLFLRPEAIAWITLDVERLRAGELWRLVTWLGMPVSTHPIWILFALYWLYVMGTSLEERWGAFRYQLYWLVGIVVTAATSVLTGAPATNAALIMSLFLAFATYWPDYTIYVFMLLPVRVKWLALLDACLIVQQIVVLPGWAKLLPLVAIANYFLFCTPTLIAHVREKIRQAGRVGAQAQWRSMVRGAQPAQRRCAICGVSDEDPNVEFRVCSCERCGGVRRDLCLTHARNH